MLVIIAHLVEIWCGKYTQNLPPEEDVFTLGDCLHLFSNELQENRLQQSLHIPGATDK